MKQQQVTASTKANTKSPSSPSSPFFPATSSSPGVWVTELKYANIYGLNRCTLARWRMEDRRAGLKVASAGYPVYKYFGRSVRYLIETGV